MINHGSRFARMSKFVRRCFCTHSELPSNPDLMSIDRIVMPNLFRSAYYTFYTNLFIVPKTDPSFKWEPFMEGARVAVSYITNKLSRKDFTDLEGGVTTEVIETVKNNIEKWKPEDLPNLVCEDAQVMFNVPYFVSLQESGDISRFKINLVYHYVPGLEAKRSIGSISYKEFEKRGYCANYHFERVYKDKKAETGWVITALNHFNLVQQALGKFK